MPRRLETPSKEPSPARPFFLQRNASEESIRTEFCEGPMPDDFTIAVSSPHGKGDSMERPMPATSDRNELIERIKSGERMNWLPTPKLTENFNEARTSQEDSRSPPSSDTGLLPAIELRSENVVRDKGSRASPPDSKDHPGHEIERPKSALHSGDFTENSPEIDKSPVLPDIAKGNTEKPDYQALLGTSPTTPWYQPHSSLRAAFQSDLLRTTSNTSSIDIPGESSKRPGRNRAPSLQSFSSSFVLKPPTSPLVQQSNNDDLDFSPIDLSTSPSKSSRRHTLPHHGFQALHSSPNGNYAAIAQAARQPPPMQRESSFPFQGHRPRMSLSSSFSLQAPSSPQTPASGRSRRPSVTSEASPLQHASMVGSYEESILRGRMSATPSRPLDFTASIGALGKGDCKPKHPAHVSVGFPAVYYSWSNGGGRSVSINDEPSPYVGLIDLEHKLPPPEIKARPRKRHETPPSNDEAVLVDLTNKSTMSRKRDRRKRRSPSPLIRLGGSYRIPQQGHLQILIKNPNKTAVKLFLVPYDLEGMEPGTKTFIRQRCYSAGPIIEKPLTSRSVSDSIIESRSMPADAKSKPTLRYLIQVNICCPSRGRFYLYKSIHVVFANRVPDNKESLRNEILWPEPRYSIYKPTTENTATVSTPELKSLAARSQRRLSYGGFNTHGASTPDTMEGVLYPTIPPPPSFPALPDPILAPPTPPRFSSSLALIKSEKSSLYSPPNLLAITAPEHDMMPMTTEHSPTAAASFRKASVVSSSSNNSSTSSDGYGKLSRGEAGYGGLFGMRPGTPEPGKGLLARKLRGIDVEMSGTASKEREE